jgi:hypothetical protein
MWRTVMALSLQLRPLGITTVVANPKELDVLHYLSTARRSVVSLDFISVFCRYHNVLECTGLADARLLVDNNVYLIIMIL